MPLLNQLKKKDSRKVVIIRHGQTLLNTKDEIRGWLDVPLDPKGHEQAEAMGKKLRDSGVDILIASDLLRTLQTALCISRESGIPLIATTPALRPWNVGKYTGKPASEVHPILFKMAIEEPEKPIEGGESFEAFKYRVLMGTVALLNEYSDKTVGLVAHHRNDRIFHGWVEAGCNSELDIDFDEFGSMGIDPGTFEVLEFASDLLK